MRYQAFRLVIDSEIALPGLPRANAEPDVHVTRGNLAWHSEPTRAWSRSSDGALMLRLPGIATYRVTRAGIQVDSVRDQPEAGALLVATVLPLLLLQRDFLVLHGSAVDSPQGAVAFIGRVAIGTSTLAAALVRRGYPLLSDGVVALNPENGVIPAYPQHQLWPNTLAVLGMSPCAPLRPGIRKRAVASRAWTGETRPLRAVFLTNVSDELIVRQVRPQTAYICDQILSYRRLVRESDCAHLAETVPHFQLGRPQDLSRLEAILDRVEHGLASAQAPTGKVAPTPAPPTQTYESPPGFVWLASYPKSGNTWVRAMLTAWDANRPLAEAAEGVSEGSGHPPDLGNLLGHSLLGERHYFDEQLGLDSDLLTLDELMTWRSHLYTREASQIVGWRIRKVHDVYDHRLFPREAAVGVIYVMRNPLDVAESYRHHYQLSIEEAVQQMNESLNYIHWPIGASRDLLPQRIGTWSEHVRSWVEESGHILLLLRYEDMLADPRATLRRLIEAMGDRWDEARAQSTLQATSFTSLQNEELRTGFSERPPRARSFFRQGRSGAWRESLPPELARQICLDHGEMMKRYGYGPEVEEVLGA